MEQEPEMCKIRLRGDPVRDLNIKHSNMDITHGLMIYDMKIPVWKPAV